ncbi:MAG: Unknown protein [uncultured Thiotrichaceae bacterium]|uniref:Type III secretion protein n=1 Tax=uncultured Thiotrichaceae bacterium TaxID=298394 RepID=A0A6S6T9J9_9GAMM|nr:MAG: Unknown protein [uncultured Thiotrichaceae bacterium]
MSLDQLQKIRNQRLERTYIEVQLNSDAEKQAIEAIRQARQDLENFMIRKKETQDHLFDQLNDGSFSIDEMATYNKTLSNIDAEEMRVRENIPLREKELHAAQNRLKESKEKLQSVTKDLEKVKEFITVVDKEKLQEEEKAEESLIDELATLRSQ